MTSNHHPLVRPIALCVWLLLLPALGLTANPLEIELTPEEIRRVIGAPGTCPDPDDKPTTLALSTWSENVGSNGKGWYQISDRYCASVTWTGNTRPTHATTAAFLRLWQDAVKANVDVDSVFTHEVEMSDGDNAYWLPIQASLLEPMQSAKVRKFSIQFRRLGMTPESKAVLAIQAFGDDVALAPKDLVRAKYPGSEDDRVAANLQYLIHHHPDEAFAKTMDEWVSSGSVALAMNVPIQEMAVTLTSDPPIQPVMLINPDWFLNKARDTHDEDQRYKMLVLYHEYIHLKEHFDGNVPLQARILRTEVTADPERFAELMWNAEYAAYKAELALAQRLGWTDLLPLHWQDPAVLHSEIEFVRVLGRVFAGGAAKQDKQVMSILGPYLRQRTNRLLRSL